MSIVEGVLALDQLLRSDHSIRSAVLVPQRARTRPDLVQRLDAHGVGVLRLQRSQLAVVAAFAAANSQWRSPR